MRKRRPHGCLGGNKGRFRGCPGVKGGLRGFQPQQRFKRSKVVPEEFERISGAFEEVSGDLQVVSKGTIRS